MKRVMSLIVVMAVLLFSQLAFAEWEFQPGEFTEIWEGEVQDQGLPDQELNAAGLKIIPLQGYTHLTSAINEAALPWLHLGEYFYTTVVFTAYGIGEFKETLTITDVKTGISKTIKYAPSSPPFPGNWWFTRGHDGFTDDPSKLPRVFKLTHSFKVGTIVKSVSYKIMLVE